MSFHESIPAFLRADNAPAFLRAITELPAGVDIVKLLRYGFEHQGKNVSFVQLCVEYRAHDVIEQLAASAPGGVTLNDLSHWKPVTSWSDREEHRSLAHASVLGSWPAGLELALRLQPDAADLTRLLPHQISTTSLTASLHFIALDQAVSKSDLAEHLHVQRQPALLLKAHGAPLKVHDLEGVAAGGEAFFSRRWTPSVAQETAQLLRTYVQDGLVDVDLPVTLQERAPKGRLPMLVAMQWGCPPAARELITLDCDLRKVMDAASVSPGVPVDMLKVVRTFGHYAEVAMAMSAAITEGLMQRRLKELSQEVVSQQAGIQASSNPEGSGPAPISRRKMRSTL